MSRVASLRGERSLLDRLLEKLLDRLDDRLLESVLEKLLEKLLERDDETLSLLWSLSQTSLSASSIGGRGFFRRVGLLFMRAAIRAGMRGVNVRPRNRHGLA